jgi:hypothetical protein
MRPSLSFSLVAGVLLASSLRARAEEFEAANASPRIDRHEADVPQVADSDKPGRSQDGIKRMREILAKVLTHLEEAREERDVVKLNCVNEKLTAVKGLLKISEQADVTMQEALARRDSDVAGHEFEKVSIALRKCEQLLAESEACVGELAVYSGDTELEVTVEEEVKTDPTSNTGGVAGGVDLARPVPASPAQ